MRRWREIPALSLLERALHIKKNWIEPSHRSGANTHNVSLTCYYKEWEQEQIVQWLINEATRQLCYKVTLDCSDHIVPFYETIGFEVRGKQMSKLLVKQ